MNDALVTATSVSAIIALVNVLKPLGIPGKFNALLAVVLGVAIQAALWIGNERSGSLTYMLTLGAVAGLSASGAWDVAKKVSPTDTTLENDHA